MAVRRNTDFSQNVRMLGYLDQQPLYNAANFGAGGCWNNVMSEQINSTVSRPRLTIFLCPSDTPPTFGIYAGDSLPIPITGSATAPGTNYQGSYGSNMEFNVTMTGSPPNGVSTSFPTVWALGSRKGGEVISSDSY